ncbi:hypothetical protein ACWNG8_21615 [Aeromonas veronii]
MNQQMLQVQLMMRDEPSHSNTFLPVSIVDARGQVLSTGVVSPQRPTELIYERGSHPVFVRMALPNGTTKTQSLFLNNQTWLDEVTFQVGYDDSIFNWMTWSTTRLDMKLQGGSLLNQPGMKDAWFQLWEKLPNALHWRQAPIEVRLNKLHHSQEAIQFDLGYSQYSRALVVRLNNEIPQVVSLPNQETNVLVTTLRTLSGTVMPRVVVGGYSQNAEAIMEFLLAGRLSSVETLLDPGNDLAHQLLYDKVKDPIAATAAAYYLLRKRDWERLPSHWLDNLSNWYNEIPDVQLIRASSQIERGMPLDEAASLAAETLSQFFVNGIPLFSEATWLLSDLLSMAEKAIHPLPPQKAKMLRRILASSRPSGLSFVYAGKTPGKPMAANTVFELRQGMRGDLTLAKSIRQRPAPLKPLKQRVILQPSQPSLKTANRQTKYSANACKIEVNTLKCVVPNNSETKTLFLRKVLGKSEIDAQ